MDPVRLGRQVRALRRRRGWRQVDLGAAARVSRATISRVERGQADDVTLRTVDAIVRAVSARLELVVSWGGEGLDRLLDAEHASLVETVAGVLRSLGWEVAVEVTLNIGGERGSIDVLAFHPATGVVLIVEVKTVVPDLQATLFVLDRKTRLAAQIARQRGWIARGAGRLLVVGASRTARRRVEAHGTVFATVFPSRNLAVKRWLRRPTADPPFSGLWLVPNARHTNARQRVAGRSRRVRAL